MRNKKSVYCDLMQNVIRCFWDVSILYSQIMTRQYLILFCSDIRKYSVQHVKYRCCPHKETSQLISSANQLTGFYVRAALAFNGLIDIGDVFKFKNSSNTPGTVSEKKWDIFFQIKTSHYGVLILSGPTMLANIVFFW